MKKLLFLLTLLASLAMPPLAGAKDKDKNKDKDYDRDKKSWNEMKDDVRGMREDYGRLIDLVNMGNVSGRTMQSVQGLSGEVQRVSGQVDHGNYNYGEMRNRISQLRDAINRTRDQANYERAQRPRTYYRYR